MMFRVAIVTMSIGVVLCGESCFSVPQGHNVTLTCSGQAQDTFRHIYWKSDNAQEVIASCYDSHDDCYIRDTQRYRANREDPSDTSFHSSLIINDVREGMIIKCLLWLAGTKDEITINTTRVLVDGDCDRMNIEVPIITSTATTTANIISPTTTTTEQNYDTNTGKVKYVDTSRECWKRIFDLSHRSFLVLCITVLLFFVVVAMLVRRKIVKRRELINVIPHYNDKNGIPEGQGNFYNNLSFSADVVYSSVSPALHLSLSPRPIRPCHDELNESLLQPPAYSEIYDTGALLNDVHINAASLAHTLSRDVHGPQTDNEQIIYSTTRQYYRSNPSMNLPQTFPYNPTSMDTHSPPPDYNTSVRLKPPH